MFPVMSMKSLTCNWSVMSSSDNWHSEMCRQSKNLDAVLKKAMDFHAVFEDTISMMKTENYL